MTPLISTERARTRIMIYLQRDYFIIEKIYWKSKHIYLQEETNVVVFFFFN